MTPPASTAVVERRRAGMRRHSPQGRGALLEADPQLVRGTGTGSGGSSSSSSSSSAGRRGGPHAGASAVAVRRRRQHGTPARAAAASAADSSVVPLLAEPPVVASAHMFRVGELVERRDRGEDWKTGYVTKLSPLEVTVNADRSAAGYVWDEVRPVQWESHAPSLPKSPGSADGSSQSSTPGSVRPDSPVSVAQSTRAARRGSIAGDRWALASKEVHHKARREIESIASEQAHRTLADERAIIFSVTVYHLGEVNLMQQSFFADVGIHMSWLEPDLKDNDRTSDVTDLSPTDPRVHVPAFFIENRLEVRPIQDPIITLRRKDPAGVVRWEQRFAGTFMELLDLRYFPFDVQTLSIGAAHSFLSLSFSLSLSLSRALSRAPLGT
eukprot:COSAG02_NODE_193_length_29843_cov_30.519903_35_plen_383_part_00